MVTVQLICKQSTARKLQEALLRSTSSTAFSHESIDKRPACSIAEVVCSGFSAGDRLKFQSQKVENDLTRGPTLQK